MQAHWYFAIFHDMKTTHLLLFFTSIISLNLMAQSAVQAPLKMDCQNPPVQSCNFYRECLEDTYQCGNSGYALGYGEKYCNRFLSIEKKLSEEGKLFNQLTRSCLQKKLIPILNLEFQKLIQIEKPLCSEILDYAFDSHPECYTEHDHSICFLNPVTDLPIIFSQYKTKDLLTQKSMKQMLQVAGACIGKIGDRLFDILPLSEGTDQILTTSTSDRDLNLQLQMSFWIEQQKILNQEVENQNNLIRE